MLNEKKIGKGGQLTIPAHIRRELGIQVGEKFEIIKAVGGGLMLERVTGSCIICGGRDELVAMNGKYLCRSCIVTAAELMERREKDV